MPTLLHSHWIAEAMVEDINMLSGTVDDNSHVLSDVVARAFEYAVNVV